MPETEEAAAENTETIETSGGDEGGQTPAPRVEVDRASLESKTEAAMAAARKGGAFGADDDAELEAAAESESDETPAETGEESDTPANEGGEQTQTEEKPQEAAASGAPTLPAAYRRSLKAYEWTDAEIDSNFKALGPKFLEMAAKVHQNRTAEIQKWADLGRQARTQNKDGGEQKPEQLKPLNPVDLAALKKKYGDNDMVEELYGPVNAAIQYINTILPAVQQTQARSQQAAVDSLVSQVETFFKSKEVEPYADKYGTATETPSETQIAEKNKVLELADAIVAGATAQGQQITLQKALTFALDSLSGGEKVKAARQQIVKTLKQREKGITLTPTSRSNTATVKPGDRTALERKIGPMMAAAFG